MMTPTLATLRSLLARATRQSLPLFLILLAANPARGGLAIDVTKSTDRSSSATTIATPAFTTTAGNDLLLAFIATDGASAGITVTGITGGGLTWALVRRTNAQQGTAEIWRALAPSILSGVTVTATLSQSVAASITVVSFTGADTSGTNGSGAIGNTAGAGAASGAPSASLVTTRNNSWVFGVGNDWDKAIARTAGSSQTLTHQYLATIGDTYWVQQQTSPTPLSGTQVFINDTAPTADRYNLSLVEILPAPASGGTTNISGAIAPAANGAGATVTLALSGTAIASVIADGSGNYTFTSLSNGIYTVTPSKSGFNFTPASTNVTINGSSQTANFSASPQVWVLSGTVSPTALGTGTLLTLGGAHGATTNADASGNFSFPGLTNGNYTVTPSKAGTTFAPASQPATINGANSNISFIASAVPTWSITGSVSPAALGTGTLLTLGGAHGAATNADASGNFSFPGLTNGNYTVTPSKAGTTFAPASQPATINGANSNINFTASAVPWSISGTVSPASIGSGTLLALSGALSATTNANSSGNYTFPGLANGTYTVTPNKTGDSFNPVSQTLLINGASAAGVNFTATAVPPTNQPDLSDIIPPGQISIVGTGTNRMFQYTHDTYNGGSGPLEIQPVYNPASGNYQGYQHIYSFQSGTWTMVQSIPVAGAFVFDVAHGHFHFPFASYGLYAANPDGSIGHLVALSPKVGFCIGDSFVYNPSLPNAGVFGNLGACTDPTSLRGLSIGCVDEYDQTDEGQSIPIPNLTNGVYWLRSMVDPFDYFAEDNKTNNETDTQISITNNTVTVLQTIQPVLTLPPAITLTSPSAGTLSGTVPLTASTPITGGSGVQFLVDGLPFGNVVSNAPYTLSWDTTTVLNGSHWLAAQTADSTGHYGTSPVTLVTVNNSSTVPPTVQLTDPEPGSTVSAVITVGATAAAQIGIPTVQFYVDNVALGSPLITPPFMTTWNTETATAGLHVLTASAVDIDGLSNSSAPVSVTVDNSHPANRIGIDATTILDGTGPLQTPAFSTTTTTDLLVAFVAYDGPSTAPQTATVSGGGVLWLLAKRSNAQHGTSEIWVAKATDFLSSVTVTAQSGTAGYHGSLTVIAFTNAAGPGVVGQASAASGAPDIFLPGVIAGNWVFAVGNDWDKATARIPVSGQVLVHQKLDTATGDTFWVQSTTAPSAADALVDIHDSAPAADRWNYCAVEIVATRQ